MSASALAPTRPTPASVDAAITQPVFSAAYSNHHCTMRVLHTHSGSVVAIVPYGDLRARNTAHAIADALNAAGLQWDGSQIVRGRA